MLICYLKHWAFMGLNIRILLCGMGFIENSRNGQWCVAGTPGLFTSNPFVLRRPVRLLNDRIMPILIGK